jgi:hypothetical protein
MTNLFKKTGLLVGVSLSVLTLSAEAGFAADPVAPDSGYQPYVKTFTRCLILPQGIFKIQKWTWVIWLVLPLG